LVGCGVVQVWAEILMKPHYFDQEKADDDMLLSIAITQGYVPETCLLGGQSVLVIVSEGGDPCKGCEGPREKCHGRPKD
jgi:hypothetical protein